MWYGTASSHPFSLGIDISTLGILYPATAFISFSLGQA
jgi:hypothetical protein